MVSFDGPSPGFGSTYLRRNHLVGLQDTWVTRQATLLKATPNDHSMRGCTAKEPKNQQHPRQKRARVRVRGCVHAWVCAECAKEELVWADVRDSE